MRPAFGHLGIVISLEGRIVFHYVVSCIDQRIPENPESRLDILVWLALKFPD